MRFEYLSHDRIKVSLSAQDISEAGLDLESTEDADIKRLRSYLFFLFSKIKLPAESEEKENNATLYIEIYPRSNGGALIYFIIDRKNTEICEPSVFCFSNSDDIIKAAVALYSSCSHRLYKSALYRCDNVWLFIICPLDGSLNCTERLLSEYGEHLSDGALTVAAIKEHCKPIIREHAADILAFYFG